jgi:hypothetical protein
VDLEDKPVQPPAFHCAPQQYRVDIPPSLEESANQDGDEHEFQSEPNLLIAGDQLFGQVDI